MSFTLIIDLLGTLAFAVSGIRLAAGKDVDWFGAYIIGLVTATGGGTVRDLLLDVTPFWMEDPRYIIMTGFALLSILIFKGRIINLGRPLFLFDAIGLGLFTIVGVSKSLALGYPAWVCIIMGGITGSIGGVIRDVLLNEVPLLFRKDIYALACIVGGIVFILCRYIPLEGNLPEILGAVTVILIRVVAVKYHIQLPILKK